MTDESYAPKSPDLSSFRPAAPTTSTPPLPQHYHQQSHHLQARPQNQDQHQPFKHQTIPTSAAYPYASHLPYQNFPNTDSGRHHRASVSLAPAPIKEENIHYTSNPVKSEYPPYPTSATQLYYQPGQYPLQNQQDIHGIQALGFPNASSNPPHNFVYSPQQQQAAFGAAQPQALSGNIHPYQPSRGQYPYSSSPGSEASTMPPRRAQPPPVVAAIDPSPVRTKFPTARIKRIMQADEEVGKVAQQTPIAVGKALEIFMINVVTKGAEIAKEKNSKRVTAQMLKQVIETDGQYDFLADIAAKVGEEEKRGSRAAKGESESSEEEPEPEPKKKGRGGARRKKASV